MMNRTIATSFAAAAVMVSVAQGPLSLGLQQAMDLAGKQSYAVRSSELEAQKAAQRTKEVTAIGFPQVNGQAEMSHFIDVPTQLVPNFFVPPGPGVPEYFPAQFAVPWTTKAGVTISQLIFDGSYLVGLKAARELATQSEEELQKAQADARNQAAKAYMGVLAAEEGVRLVGEGIPLLEKSQTEVTAMKDAGFMESTDVDRITIQLEQARAQQRSFQQQAEVARMLLALTLGVPQGTPLTLTDKLEGIVRDPNETALAEAPFDPAGHIEQSYANTLVRLQELNLRNERTKALPNLAGYFNHQQAWNGPSFDPGGEYRFYPATIWGLTMNIPILSSGMRYHKVQQNKLALEQVKINQTATEQRLRMGVEQQRSITRQALDAFLTEERSMTLARNIFERTTVKFTNGAAASFELTQEQGNYLLAQQTYIQRMVELLMARADLRKALDLY